MQQSKWNLKNRRMQFCGMLILVSLVNGCATTPEKPAEPVMSEQQLMATGEASERAGDYNHALLDYVKAATANPKSANAHYHVAHLQTLLGNQSTAQEAFSRTLSIDPKHIGALEGLGLINLELGQPAEATRLLKQALALDPRRWRSANGLGVLADLAGNHAQAQAYFSMGLKLSPARPELLNNLGYSYYLGGNLNASQDYFQRALSKAPEYKTAWSNLALVRVRLGNNAGAIDAFSESLKPYQAYNNVGYLLYMRGDLDKAREYLQHAIALSPSYYALAEDNLRRVEAVAQTHADAAKAARSN